MERRALGRSGLDVPVLGFGCGGSARLMVSEDRMAQTTAIRSALELGIDYFDTAPAYGDGRSETNLGAALAGLGSPPVTISTKVVLGEEDLGRPRDAVLRSFDASLHRLRRDRVDMLLMHNRVAGERPVGRRIGVGPVLGLADVVDPGGVLDGFRELLDSGAIRACGITAFGGEPAAISEVLRTGVPSVINAAFSLIEPTAALAVAPPGGGDDHGQVIPLAASLGVGVIAIRVFGSGRLLLPSDDPVTVSVQDLAAGLGGGDAHRGALGFVLATPGVDTAVIGFSEAGHVHAAVDAIRAGTPAAGALDEVTARLAAIGSGPAAG
ncbi:MAG TPA: aldo/keto reductase [Acidimicrobiales bacterium]|nr:aldo/keto reductase [Acidimicrobiales bacterium]